MRIEGSNNRRVLCTYGSSEKGEKKEWESIISNYHVILNCIHLSTELVSIGRQIMVYFC